MNKETNNQIKKFKESSYIEVIMKIMNQNNGYVTSKTLTDFGISRQYLSIMNKKGMIEKIGRGVYIDKNKLEDSFYTLSLELPNIIYSHFTALYFYNISPKAPYNEYDVTVCGNYFNYKLKNHNVFYVDRDILTLGLTTVKTPNGNIVHTYDIERSICDIIRSINRFDIDLVKRNVRQYLKMKDKDLTKLSYYAEKMGIKNKVMNFVGMLYE